MNNAHHLPPLSAKAVPDAQPGTARRKPAGKVPAWALKLGTLFTTFSIFAGSFSNATTHLYATNAPLQPATVATDSTSASNSTSAASTGGSSTIATSTGTTTLTSSVRTTTQTAVTTTRHS